MLRILVILPFPISFSLISYPQDLSDPQKIKIIEKKIKDFEGDFSVPQLSVLEFKELKKKSHKQIVLVDVRTPQERKVSTIHGAISQEQFWLKQADYRGKTVVSYCTIGYRSSLFTEKLMKMGIKAYNLRGSLLSWVHSGGKLYTPAGQETNQVHVYGKDWDLVPTSYKSRY